MNLTSAKPRVSASAVLVCSFLAALLIWTQYWGSDVRQVAEAQEQRPQIHSVEPQPPFCIILDSEFASERTLTIKGENLGLSLGARLQFRRTGTRERTIPFANGLNWESSEQVTLDIGLIEEHIEYFSILRLQVRITDEEGRGLSDWSDDFGVARSARFCGAVMPAPTPAPTPGPFPPTSPVRGVAGDLWADVIIGKPDFSQVAPKSVVPFKVNNPTGVIVDRSVEPGRAYVWDSGNSRILGIDLAKCYEGSGPCSADIVIGQPSGYDHAACNGDNGLQRFPVRARPTAATLCGIPDHSLSPWEAYSFVSMTLDGNGNLYVPDFFNHRVLKYNSPFESDTVADQVWGQADFSGRVCNQGTIQSPTAESLCFQSDSVRTVLNHYGAGVEIDSDGNLWVADVGNNRVLRFPAHQDSGEIGMVADLVLGQTSFHSAVPGTSLGRLHAPSAVRFDSKGWLYVADAANSRVLVFKPPFASGMRADGEFGSQLHHPTSLEIDPFGRGIWVVDAGNFMVELWNPAGSSVLQVLGKSTHQPDGNCGPPLREVSGAPHLCPIGGSIGLEAHGNALIPVFHGPADVIRFPTMNTKDDSQIHSEPDKRLFFPPFEDNFRDSKGIHSARGIATWQDQLIVSDIRRLMFWNGLDSLASGQIADGVIGDEYAVGEWQFCCGRVKADSAGRLWVLSFQGTHFLDVYQLPLTEDSVPIHTIWKQEAEFSVLGTGERITLGSVIHGIAPVNRGEFLWLSDTDNHRVIRIRDPLNDPVVDIILGQDDAAGSECNQGRRSGAALDELCYPGALTIDRFGNLFVSDHALEVNGNLRLLVFSQELTPVTNTETIFAPPATKVFKRSAVGVTDLWADPWEYGAVMRKHERTFWAAATWEPAFDSTNRMVVGYNGYVSPRFVGVYDEPLGPDELPSSFLYDFGSMPYTATFDDNDNLYVGDINRGRVLVYFNPFNNPPSPPTEVPPHDPAPLPEYPVKIEAVSPGPPFCLSRSSAREYETTLQLAVDGLPRLHNLTFEFRKMISLHRAHLDIGQARIEEGGSRITLDQQWFWQRLWPHIDKVTLTVRILEGGNNRTPISNWSPAFLLANDALACGIALPTPTPTSTSTPTPIPTPTATATPTPSPTATAAPSPTPTAIPTTVPSPTPVATFTAEPLPTPAIAPTPESSPTPPATPTPTPTPSPIPTPTSTATPTPELPAEEGLPPLIWALLAFAVLAVGLLGVGILIRRR